MNRLISKWVSFCLTTLMTSCAINPNTMFKVPKNFEYSNDQTIGNIEYKIAPNDKIAFSIYTNDGFKLIDLTTAAVSVNAPLSGSGNPGMNNQDMYLVEPDGQIKLPIIGKIKISGLTVREAERQLENQYSAFYNKPFVIIRVTNRRVLIFPGNNGVGRVVPLENENTTLVEAIAQAGGLTNVGKAYKIKLIRGDLRHPKVMHIDLSTIEGMAKSNLLLQANDIIYVESAPRISQEVLQQITPFLSIITTLALIYQIAIGIN